MRGITIALQVRTTTNAFIDVEVREWQQKL